MDLATMMLSYEVEKLKTKLNFCSDLASGIDKKIIDLKIEENEGLKAIRDELRDLRDFLKEDKKMEVVK